MRNGRGLSSLPELDTDHPLQRPEREESLLAVMKSFPTISGQVNSKPAIDQEPDPSELTIVRPKRNKDQEPAVGEQTIVRPKLHMGSVVSESAKIYAFLDIQQNEQVVQRIAITENAQVVGRSDPRRGITPAIDLTAFDTANTVSRQHARIHIEKDDFFIKDLESRNKTRVGEMTLNPHKMVVLHSGDVVSFGSVKAAFRLLGTSKLPEPWSPS